jgi:hypothetical protein
MMNIHVLKIKDFKWSFVGHWRLLNAMLSMERFEMQIKEGVPCIK